jgi:hypothetical protein
MERPRLAAILLDSKDRGRSRRVERPRLAAILLDSRTVGGPEEWSVGP